MDHGPELTKGCCMLQKIWRKHKCNTRREGDSDQSKKILAETAKSQAMWYTVQQKQIRRNFVIQSIRVKNMKQPIFSITLALGQ